MPLLAKLCHRLKRNAASFAALRREVYRVVIGEAITNQPFYYVTIALQSNL